ncbi:DotA/TraY family protein [Lonepinella sp. BR2357]|uniref:DotA/TraY family protein n=1 Tax=Lonepinella sp. BR2357 TaxID=3434549 RepID=UPI003F6DD356
MDIFKNNIDHDYLIENILKPVFENQNALSDFMLIFSTAFLIIGALLVAYNVIQSTYSTASLGKIQNTAAQIIRNCLGIALLFPIGDLHWNGAQRLLEYVAVQGVKMADTAFENFDLETTLNRENVKFTSSYESDLVKVLKTAISAHSCVQTSKKVIPINSNGKASDFTFKQVRNNNNEIVFNFGDFSTNSAMNETLCGQIAIAHKSNLEKKSTNSTISSTTNALMDFADMDFVNKSEIEDSLKKAHIQATLKLITEDASKISKLAQTANVDQVSKEIESSIKAYNKTIEDTFNSLSLFNQDLTNKMKENGIASLGSFFFKLSLVNSHINQAVNNSPDVKNLSNIVDLKNKSDEDCSIFTFLGTSCKTMKVLEKMNTEVFSDQERLASVLQQAFLKLATSSQDLSTSTASAVQVSSDDDKFKAALKPIYKIDFSFLKTENKNITDPIVVVQNFGASILQVVELLLAGTAVLAVLPFVSGLVPILLPILLTLLVAGAVIAFYYPLKFFLVWTSAIFGWVVQVCLSLFGVNFWLITMLSPHFQDHSFIGKSGKGLLMILALATKPILLVGGFIASITILSPILGFFNYFFGFAVESIYNEGSSLLYPIYLISTTVIYITAILKIMDLIFNLVTELPDRVFEWISSGISGSLGSLTSYAHNLDENTAASSNKALSSTVAVGALGINAAQAFSSKFAGKAAEDKKPTDTDNKSNLNGIYTNETKLNPDHINQEIDGLGSSENQNNSTPDFMKNVELQNKSNQSSNSGRKNSRKSENYSKKSENAEKMPKFMQDSARVMHGQPTANNGQNPAADAKEIALKQNFKNYADNLGLKFSDTDQERKEFERWKNNIRSNL